VIWEHTFVLSTNRKGAIAEAKITTAAIELGIPVLKPVAEHGRYDLAFEIGGQIYRVQCKWGNLDPEAGVIKINLASSGCTPNGYERRSYSANEIDLVAVYCGDADRCYLLPRALVVDRRGIYLRLSPARNQQRACINLSSQYEFNGAVAQLEERRLGMAEVRGSSPLSSTPIPSNERVHTLGANQFRHHFGYYMERAAAGDEIHITRHGRPFARLMPPANLLEAAA
jgi:prevent-host-death family protein